MMDRTWSERVILKDVTSLNKEIGRGSYGKVFTVKYCGLVCAAKEIHSVLLDEQGDARESVIESFLQECYQCSEIRHPNIVQFMGVYYDQSNSSHLNLPIMVMELMDKSLTDLVENQKGIEMKVKISILHDVSLGLSYLHGQTEPIVHRDLSPNNVLLTAQMVAKISDLGVARVLTASCSSRRTRSKFTQAPGTLDFMAPETLYDNPSYDTAIDVFSFAGIALHLFCEEWPTPTQPTQTDTKTRKLVALTEVERRQKYFDKISGKNSATIKLLLKSCLDNEPSYRPSIATVSEKIESLKDLKVDEPKSSHSNRTMKEKPQTRHRTIFRHNTDPGINNLPQHESLVSASLTSACQNVEILPQSKSAYQNMEFLPEPKSAYQNMEFLSQSESPSSCVLSDLTASLPSKFDSACYLEQQSENSCLYNDATASLPRNFDAKKYLKRPVPMPRTRALSCNSDAAKVNISNSSNHNSCPPKVTKSNIRQMVNQYKAATKGFMQPMKVKSKLEKVPLISALQSGKYNIKWRRCAHLLYPMYAASVTTDEQHVYVTGDSIEREALNVIFAYTVATDSWSQLPPSDHCWGILQIVGNKLTIFGGIDSDTKMRTNRVSTFEKSTKSWHRFYPDMIEIRFRPGVVTHLDYVIVAGGNKDALNIRNDIEVLNWRQRKRWIKSSVCLPAPMWAFSPIISNDELYIVGYSGEGNRTYKEAYKIPVVYITTYLGQKHQGTNQWVTLPSSYYYYSSMIPNSCPPVFVGGEDSHGVQSSNISMYDSYSNLWRYVDSLSSPRAGVAVAMIDDYSIIVIGGYTKGCSAAAAKMSSLPTVEIGEAELA